MWLSNDDPFFVHVMFSSGCVRELINGTLGPVMHNDNTAT